jgi:hypothetical protein
MLLKSLNFDTSYNLSPINGAAAWAPINVRAGTDLFKDKLGVSMGAILNPYAIDSNGNELNIFNINNGGSLFRLTAANLSLNYSLTNKNENKEKDTDSFNNKNLRSGGREDDLFGKTTDFTNRNESQFGKKDDEEEKFPGFFNAKLPWDLRLAYSLTYANRNREREITNSSLMFSGNIDISPKWKMGISSGYDFVRKGVTYSQLRFERDLLSWRMDFNWTPFGDNKTWYFFIGVSSSVLKDIKWDKHNIPDRRN